jgi:thimet oligopeptidase
VGASFGITVAEVIPPYKWVDDLRLFVISDTKTSFPLGLVYLDLFPRKHKFGHFAMFNLLDGRKLPNGLQQNPVCAIIGNFTPPRKGQPALLSHEEVVTLFHEFGHALHVILSKGKYSMFAGGNVAQDFSEVHSQLLEEWARDPQTLNLFAADYRNPRKKIPVNILRKLRAAQMASVGHSFSRQLSFGLLDLALHSRKRHATAKQLNKFSNQILNDKSIPMPSTSAFIASFGHLNSCSAGYYGYIWSDAIVANLLPKFASAKHGFLDHKPGLKIRRKIYEIGGKRDSAKCIKDVLGHNFKLKPFLRQLGIQNA